MKYNFYLTFLCFLLFSISMPSTAEAENSSILDVQLPNLNDEMISLNTYREENKLIAYFWATWCAPCLPKLRYFQDSKDRLEQKGYKIVLINYLQDKDEAENYLLKYSIDMDTLLDKYGVMDKHFGIQSLPFFLKVGKSGFIEETGNRIKEYPEFLQIYQE